MQWLIDIIFEIVMARFEGLIVMWSGALDTIPDGWALCDGTQGTPDLTDKFVIGADAGLPPDSEGGSDDHSHSVTTSAHSHTIAVGANLAAGATYAQQTDPASPTGSTNLQDHIPPYYALAYIMKT